MIRRHSVVYALCVSLVVASSAVAQPQEPEGSWFAIAPGEDVMAAVVSVCARLALPPDVCLQVQEDVVARHKPDEGGAYAVANVESHPRFDVATIAIGGTAHTIRLRWGEDPVLLARRWCDRLGLSDGDCTTLRRAIVRTARTVWFRRHRHHKLLPGLHRYESRSGEDEWIAEAVFKGKRNGFYVDIGAGDGVHYSSTYALDKVFGWSGLCVEPTSLSGHLVAHRSCSVASNFVAESSSQTSFVVDATTPSSQFSGLVDSLLPTTNDPSSLGSIVNVATTPLADVLDDAGAPHYIDFLSLDISGAELGVLKSMDYDRYQFGAVCFAHHEDLATREGASAVLEAHGYSKALSGSAQDCFTFDGSASKVTSYVIPRGAEPKAQSMTVRADGGTVTAAAASPIVVRLWSGGVADRLAVLASASVLAVHSGRPLELDWRPSPASPVEFHELYLNAVTKHGVSTLVSDSSEVWPPTSNAPWCVIDGTDTCTRPSVVVSDSSTAEDIQGAVDQVAATVVLEARTPFQFPELSCDSYTRHVASFYRNLVPSFTVEAAQTAFAHHFLYSAQGVGVGVAISAQSKALATPHLDAMVPVIQAILSRYEQAVFAVVCTGWDGCAASLRNRLGVGSDVILAFEPLGDTPRDRAQADAIEWSILGQTALILASPANSVALTASAGLSVPVVEIKHTRAQLVQPAQCGATTTATDTPCPEMTQAWGFDVVSRGFVC